ncbi:MAG: hypothetical protein WBP41_07610 [Saprospiraceae bacterium]
MENKIKTILSALCIGLFIVFALASELLDESSNTEVQLSNCTEEPSISGNLTVDIEYLDYDGDPIDGAYGNIFISEQLVDDTSTCHYITQRRLETSFTTNLQGKFTFTNIAFIHHNEGDIFRIDVNVPGDREEEYEGFQEVQVLPYAASHCIIRHKDPKLL